MADKLNEASWTSLVKKLKVELEDKPLVKALAHLDKTDAAKPAPRLDALDDVIEQLKKQVLALAKRKKELGDKPFGELKSKLDELLELAERELKSMKSAASSEDEEEESPVLLSTKMLPLLRELKKGEARFPTLIGVAGKGCAVLILRRAISPTRRKLINEALGVSGGVKYIVGECLYENKALTFVVQSQAAGLAKKLRQALLDQTGLRLKVRVRGDDGEDEEGEDEGEEEGAVPEAPPVSSSTATAAATTATSPTPTATATNASTEALAFKSRLEALLPHLKGSDAARLKASEAGAASRNHDWAAALRLLDEAEAALAAPHAETAATPPPRSTTVAPAIVYTQSRLAWLASRKKVQAEMQKLEQAILAHYRGHNALPAVASGVRKLDRVLDLFDESLADTLDAALNATDAPTKQRLHDEARAIITRYEGFLASDAMVRELDANPFVPIAVQATLSGSLKVLAAKIV